MGFSTVDQIISAISVNATMQRLCFNKTMPVNTAATTPYTMWLATGNPAVGTNTSTGRANGRSLSVSTTGGWKYSNAASGTMHLITLGAGTLTSSHTGTLILVDRMADCALAHNEATGAITGMDASTRMAATTAPGDGGQLWCEVTSAFSAASNTITFQATDQLGNTAQSLTGMVTTASQSANKSVNAQTWQTLATGITGIRALTNVTLTSGSATGTYVACIVRPLATIPIPAVGLYVERDFVVEMPNVPKLYDSSCLAFLWIAAAASTAPSIFGELRMCYN